MPHAKLWRGMATTTASLLILSLGTSAIADSRAGFLNAQLGTSNDRWMYWMSGYAD